MEGPQQPKMGNLHWAPASSFFSSTYITCWDWGANTHPENPTEPKPSSLHPLAHLHQPLRFSQQFLNYHHNLINLITKVMCHH